MDEHMISKKTRLRAEQEPTTEEILSQTVANLTLENFDLKTQVQTLAQAVAMMQIGG